jgi:hypothetical protein
MLCNHNLKVVETQGRNDLETVWRLVRSILRLRSSTSKSDYQAAVSKNLFEYLKRIGDFQSLATVYAVLSNPTDAGKDTHPPKTAHLPFTSLSKAQHAQKRPSRLRASAVNCMSISHSPLKLQREDYKLVVDVTSIPYIQLYANYLYALGLYQKRNQLLLLTNLSTDQPTLQLGLPCSCNKIPCICKLTCFFCRLPCKKLTAFCIVCKHGGHALCMKLWFQDERHCIAGCGCECILYQ